MPAWSHDLPNASRRVGYELRRTPADRPIRAIATCETLHVCWTHYWGGRTVPCEKPQCEACEALSPARSHCYLSAIDPATRDHFIFECTAGAAIPFQEWIATYGTLRGCFFQAIRPKRRRNSRVEITCKPADQTKITLPTSPNIPLAMAVIWQIPGAAVQASEESTPCLPSRADSIQIDRMRLNAADFAPVARDPRKNGSS